MIETENKLLLVFICFFAFTLTCPTNFGSWTSTFLFVWFVCCSICGRVWGRLFVDETVSRGRGLFSRWAWGDELELSWWSDFAVTANANADSINSSSFSTILTPSCLFLACSWFVTFILQCDSWKFEKNKQTWFSWEIVTLEMSAPWVTSNSFASLTKPQKLAAKWDFPTRESPVMRITVRFVHASFWLLNASWTYSQR